MERILKDHKNNFKNQVYPPPFKGSNRPDFFSPPKPPHKNNIKLVVHHVEGEEGGYEIRVQNTTDSNGKTGKNILKKIGYNFTKERKRDQERNRGLLLSDLLVIKKNWNKIIRAMTS